MIATDELKFLPNIHKDFIHDTGFNLYGTRMATCSSDGYVRVSFLILYRNNFLIIRKYRSMIYMMMIHGDNLVHSR
jgi:hypothetical protein